MNLIISGKPVELIVIGVLAILYHSINTPGTKRRRNIVIFTFLFELVACVSVIWFFGVNLFTAVICTYSIITWVPFMVINIVFEYKKRKFNRQHNMPLSKVSVKEVNHG